MVSAPAAARLSVTNPARTYVQARAAAMRGDHAQAAQLLAALANVEPGQVDIAKKALTEAIGAGQLDLALNLTRTVPPASLASDARLLLVAEEIRRGHPERALPWLKVSGDSADLSFLAPLIIAWSAADRGNADQALATINQLGPTSLLAPLADEERAFILLKFKRSAEAETSARRAIGSANSRELKLRLAFADAFLAAGDRPRALAMIEGMGAGEAAARQRIAAGKRSGQSIGNLPEAFSDVLTAFAADLTRLQRGTPPIGLVQVARYADPQNSSATALLALLLASQDRSEEALALLRTVPAGDGMISQIRDVQVRILTDDKRLNEAYQIAAGAASASTADVSDYSRLGDVLQSMKRHGEAADAYGRAIAFAQAQNLKSALWTLLLLRASALEDSNRWPEARAALQQALALAPEQPLLLIFMGYGQL